MGWLSDLVGGGSDWVDLGNDLFGGDSFGGSDGNWGGGFDWGSVWGDIGQGVVGDWWSGLLGGDDDGGVLGGLFGGGSGGGQQSGGFMNTLGNIFGGGQSGGGNIWGALLSGLGGAAQAMFDEDNIREMGKEQRLNIKEQGLEARKARDFEAQLLDHYKQKDKHRKRTALDTYGQFSLLNKWAPGYTPAPGIDVPAKPNP